MPFPRRWIADLALEDLDQLVRCGSPTEHQAGGADPRGSSTPRPRGLSSSAASRRRVAGEDPLGRDEGVERLLRGRCRRGEPEQYLTDQRPGAALWMSQSLSPSSHTAPRSMADPPHPVGLRKEDDESDQEDRTRLAAMAALGALALGGAAIAGDLLATAALDRSASKAGRRSQRERGDKGDQGEERQRGREGRRRAMGPGARRRRRRQQLQLPQQRPDEPPSRRPAAKANSDVEPAEQVIPSRTKANRPPKGAGTGVRGDEGRPGAEGVPRLLR